MTFRNASRTTIHLLRMHTCKWIIPWKSQRIQTKAMDEATACTQQITNNHQAEQCKLPAQQLILQTTNNRSTYTRARALMSYHHRSLARCHVGVREIPVNYALSRALRKRLSTAAAAAAAASEKKKTQKIQEVAYNYPAPLLFRALKRRKKEE